MQENSNLRFVACFLHWQHLNLLHFASVKLGIVSTRMDQVDQQRTIGDWSPFFVLSCDWCVKHYPTSLSVIHYIFQQLWCFQHRLLLIQKTTFIRRSLRNHRSMLPYFCKWESHHNLRSSIWKQEYRCKVHIEHRGYQYKDNLLIPLSRQKKTQPRSSYRIMTDTNHHMSYL